MEILLTVEVPATHNVPVQISIVYDENGEVASCDWRHALPDILECMEIELNDYDSDDDPDYQPIDTDTDEDTLEYDSNGDDSDY